jgi:predicted site-specific integrase-resolvase
VLRYSTQHFRYSNVNNRPVVDTERNFQYSAFQVLEMPTKQISGLIALGYVRVSTEKQADKGDSLDAQLEKIRAMAVVQGAEVVEVIQDAGESAKSLQRPGMARLLAMVDAGEVQVVIIAKLDRLTRSVRDLGDLLEQFTKKGVALVSVAESLDTGSAAGRLVLNIMTAVSQWEREAHRRAHSDGATAQEVPPSGLHSHTLRIRARWRSPGSSAARAGCDRADSAVQWERLEPSQDRGRLEQ